MGKVKIKTASSAGAMRFVDDTEGTFEQVPGEYGNEFDVRMEEEADPHSAAKKIVDVLRSRGVALVEANAPHDLLSSAFDEAESLWKDKAFRPAFVVFDEASKLDAQLWEPCMPDDQMVVWLGEQNEDKEHPKDCLGLLGKNMIDFSTGLMDDLRKKTGINFDGFWNAMLSCYHGDRKYNMHIDNPHAENERYPDNGMRLTMCYFINPHWDPSEKYNGGGLDIFLTDPTSTPKSSTEARKAPKLRVAPHADTLVMFLSERMAHQVITTRTSQPWYVLTMWCFHLDTMNSMMQRFEDMRREEEEPPSDDDDD